MARNLNLEAAARYIHWAPPGDLDGLFQACKAKVEALGVKIGRRSHVTPKQVAGDPSINVRGILQFIDSCEPVNEGDSEGEKKTKTEALANLGSLYATLCTRLGAAGYVPPEAEPAPAAPPTPEGTPDPTPLA